MPTLHLPAAHTDTDVALATEVANVVGSYELYVTWTHGEGPGLPPEIEAVTDDEPQPRDLAVRRGRGRDGPGLSALWNAIVRAAEHAAGAAGGPRDDRRAAAPGRESPPRASRPPREAA